MLRVEDLMRAGAPRLIEPRVARSGLDGFADGATSPRQPRQGNRCGICRLQIPETRTLCSYCKQYVS